MKLTEHFWLHEFDCRDGTKVPDKYIPNIKKLAENLQILRDYIGKPIHINSGWRSEKHNQRIGGKPKSQHLIGKAADITVRDMTPRQVYLAILKLIKDGKIKDGGLALYKGFVHYDISAKSRRW